ncbi:hypothetical protein Gogos_005256 [Gossypium gossypioides]|uniref:YqaJ viral recombinase domain-containing protein n=1 Tax=Gossypium gossypioides TaxID=34282 RepID=A0A7J9CJ11_GOSGO|nr:hypothetical protein [Gossypium gossypioides]
MSNCYMTRFRAVHHKAMVPWSMDRWRNGCQRTLSTSTTHFSRNTSLTVRAPTLIVLAVNLTPFDAPQRSDEWFALRRNKLTTSTFTTALGFWKGKRRSKLWHEKVFAAETQVLKSSIRCAMEWGVLNEVTAIERYKSITGHEVSSLGFAIHSKEKFDWLGASPDGLLGCFPGGGIMEVKCPYNKGKPQTALPWSTMPSIICLRECSYWDLMHGILQEFWWGNVMPAEEALSRGEEEDAKTYEPSSRHKQTGLVISKSRKLASKAKMICREIAGHIEFYR